MGPLKSDVFRMYRLKLGGFFQKYLLWHLAFLMIVSTFETSNQFGL